MKPYLTPAKFRTMGYGVDLSDVTDATLATQCQRAHSMVEAHCLVPRLPNGQNHDFRGGSIVGEQHTWRYPASAVDIGQRKAWPFNWPILAMEKFIIKVTNTQYVEIDPSELFVNQTQKYVEVVSLAITSHGLFNALVVPNIGLATPVVVLDYTYGRQFDETDEVLYFSDGKTWRAAHQWWKTDPAPVVKKDGTILTLTDDYTIDADEGTVILDEDANDDNVITVSYSHTLPSEIRDAMGEIMAHLHATAEAHERGIAHLRKVTVEEVSLERQRAPMNPGNVPADLNVLVPSAAALLASYRFDNITVR
jgi:hypothetical protein